MSNRDAMTKPMAIDVTAIKTAENSVLLRVDIISSSGFTDPRGHTPPHSAIPIDYLSVPLG
jgi:hypothetical protein